VTRRKTHLALKRIGVLVKPRLKEAANVLVDLSNWLAQRAIEMIAEPIVKTIAPQCRAIIVPREEIAQQVDLIIVLGGDGTMIATSRLMGKPSVPVLGLNFGSLGYLTEFTLDDFFPALAHILRNEVEIESRMMLDCTAGGQDRDLTRQSVLNDAVVNNSALARIIEIECLIDQNPVTTFRADGIIVASPTGSTAYSLSAGGPIIYPTMEAIIITPICPHMLTNRPLVIPDDSEVKLILRSAREKVTLTLDGQIGVRLELNDEVVIKKSEKVFNLVRPPEKNYFRLLRNKLHWGK
jgi:NAD+ kinase